MNKKIIVIISIILIIILLIIIKIINNSKKETTIMNLDNYKEITIDNIKNIEIIKYTEGGVDKNNIENREDIAKTYNYLNNKKIGKETTMECVDNTTIYIINLNNGINKKIELKCNILILNNKRYILK